MRLLAPAVTLALFALANTTHAAPGGLDPSFGTGGRVVTVADGWLDFSWQMLSAAESPPSTKTDATYPVFFL